MRPNPGTYVGKGKLRDLRMMCGLPVPEDPAMAAAEKDIGGDESWAGAYTRRLSTY
jgi:hypothetical protein